MGELIRSGQLTIAAGRIRSLALERDHVICLWTPRGGQDLQRLRAARAVNCTGPSGDIEKLNDPLLTRMVRRGDIRSDDLGLGVDADINGRLVDANGRLQSGLFGLGPVTRGALWEIIAVPDIRVQAPRVAVEVARSISLQRTGPAQDRQ